MKRIQYLYLFVILFLGLLFIRPTEGSAKWWDKFGEPQYGGTINLHVKETSSLQFDPWGPPYFQGNLLLWYDTLFTTDWTLDRDTWSFKARFSPEQYTIASLAESWEQPDAKTVIVHLRKGVHFQDKEPVNGRELVAEDVVYHFDRLCGTGSGFTNGSQFSKFFTDLVEDINAMDQYTVEFKFKQANVINFIRLVDHSLNYAYIEAPEVSQKYGDCKDWKNAVGTGPWILKDYVDGSSMSFVRNPNYWGHDERYPEKQIPYADQLKVLVISDTATAMAALRTGKIDILEDIDWRQAKNIAKTNPELLQSEIPAPGCDVLFNLNNKPFTDIRVRKAMQLALDRALIARSHYGGIVEGIPCGQIHPVYKEYAYAYDRWTKELKDEYSYDPERAKQILAEAGYPNGFSTNIVISNTCDIPLIEIIKSMFMDIGIDMEIRTFDMATYTKLIMSAQHKGLTWSEAECGSTGAPFQGLLSMTSYWTNPSTVNDPVYDDMCRSFSTITDSAGLAKRIMETDQYALEHHWKVRLFPVYAYNIYQPYIKGYSGEYLNNMGYHSRWWIDQEKKKIMGR